MIILKAYTGGCHHGIPKLIGYACVIDKVILFHILDWIDFDKLHKYEGAHHAAEHLAYHGFRWRRLHHQLRLAIVQTGLKSNAKQEQNRESISSVMRELQN